MQQKKYMVLLVDRKQSIMFTLQGDKVGKTTTCKGVYVPQKVKHGDDAWDAQDKIFRHIENHLHRHLTVIAEKADSFAHKERVELVIIGGHKPLFPKIKKHLSPELLKKVTGTFVSELKAPLQEIHENARKEIEKIEDEAVIALLQRRLHGQ